MIALCRRYPRLQKLYREQRLQEQAIRFNAKVRLNHRFARRLIRLQFTAEALAALTAMLLALELGFAETSAFYRAFKSWTGTLPGKYRQDSKQAGENRMGG